MTGYYREECSNPPPESCSDAGCPVHGAENIWGGYCGDECPDCGRSGCTGEDCYWPEDAVLRR